MSVGTKTLGIPAGGVGHRSRYIWAPAGWSTFDPRGGGRLQDGLNITGSNWFKVPADFVASEHLYPVVLPHGTGNMVYNATLYFAQNGEAYNTHTATVGPITAAVVNNTITYLADRVAMLAGLALNDLVDCVFNRVGNNAGDTVNQDVSMLGWLFIYEADM